MSIFYLPEQYVGKSLRDIADQLGGYFPRLDILGGWGGVSENTKLSAGQSFNVPTDPGSGEYQWASKVLSRTPSSSTGSTDFQSMIDKILQQRRAEVEASKAPIISQLEGEKQPLKDRYQKILESIRGKEASTIREGDITRSQEFGRRGIPLSSTMVQEELDKQRGETRKGFGTLELGAQGELEDRLSTLAQSIATLKASVSPEAFQQAMSLVSANLQKLQQDQQAQQFEESLSLQADQLALQRQQASQQASKLDTSVVTTGGRVKLINTQTGQVIADLGSSTSGSGGLSASQTQSLTQQALNQASQGKTLADLQKQFGAQLGTSNVVKLYSSVSPYGTPKEAYAQEILGIQVPSSSAPTGSSDNRTWYQKLLGIY